MIGDVASGFISDYLESEPFRLFRAGVKANAEQVLVSFFQNAFTYGADGPSSVTPDVAQAVLVNDLLRVDLPAEQKLDFPKLLYDFFDFLNSSGHAPGMAPVLSRLKACEREYQSRVRGDGSVKGVTFKHKASPTGPNEPCPCGSGKKFKKCHMGIL